MRDEALRTGEFDEALAWYRQLVPGAFDETPALDVYNVGKAVDLAHLLIEAGDGERAAHLLQAVIDYYDDAYTRGSANYPLGIAKADALSLLGRSNEAIAELERVVAEGWRMRWRYDTQFNRNLDSIRDKPQFAVLVSHIEADLAEQARQLAASGGVPSF